MKKYEQPQMEITRFEVADRLTWTDGEVLSGIYDYGQDVEEW